MMDGWLEISHTLNHKYIARYRISYRDYAAMHISITGNLEVTNNKHYESARFPKNEQSKASHEKLYPFKQNLLH